MKNKKKVNVSFKTKLLVGFLLCSLVPLLICTVLLIKIAEVRINVQAKNNVQEQMDIMNQSMNIISTGFLNAKDELLKEPVIKQALKNEYSVDETDVNKILFLATSKIRRYASFSLYDLKGNLKYTTRDSEFNSELADWWGLLYAANEKDGIPVYQGNSFLKNETHALFQGAVLLKDSDNNKFGYFVIKMNQNDFLTLFEGKIASQYDFILVTKYFHPIFGSDINNLNSISNGVRNQLFNGKFEMDDTKNFVYEIAKHEETETYLILRQPFAFNTSTSKMLYGITLVCAILCIIISFTISMILRQQFFSPIQQLQSAFRKLSNDDLTVRLPTKRNDELGQLAMDFNKMVNSISQNREERLQNQEELNQAEISLLQAQLNPNFLYNILDTIKIIGDKNQVSEINEVTNDISELLRFYLLTEQSVTLEDEINMLELYIKTQKIRLCDNFKYQIDFPENLKKCIVPKMILQPIVENAIIHGLSGIENPSIFVDIKERDSTLFISITDNGIGLPKELLEKQYTCKGFDKIENENIGLKNISIILSKHFGNKYGIFFNEGPNGVGARVMITLPSKK